MQNRSSLLILLFIRVITVAEIPLRTIFEF